MRILIVDDASEKIGTILNVLKSIPNFDCSNVEYVLDLNLARQKLSSTFYDLLILDLNMPASLGDEPSMTAGIYFVDEVMNTNRIKKPTDIVILSAFDDSLQSFKKKIERAGFIALQYNETSDEWKSFLQSKVHYLQLCQTQRRIVQRLPDCDVMLLTAVQVETSAILSWDCTWNELSIDGDPTKYRQTTLNANGKEISLIHAQLSEMGMTSAATLTSKAISHFRPKYVIMTGIAAGLEKDANLGDIMVATAVWNYSSGKYEEVVEGKQIKTALSPDPKYISINSAIEEKLRFADYKEFLSTTKKSYSGTSPEHELNVHFGPMACGVAVVASIEVVEEQIKAHARKTLGLDMESYGVYFASQSTTNPATEAIVIKSISDFADRKKGDGVQPYAAYTSSMFAKHIIKNVLDIY